MVQPPVLLLQLPLVLLPPVLLPPVLLLQRPLVLQPLLQLPPLPNQPGHARDQAVPVLGSRTRSMITAVEPVHMARLALAISMLRVRPLPQCRLVLLLQLNQPGHV